jgi:hypothetical protein
MVMGKGKGSNPRNHTPRRRIVSFFERDNGRTKSSVFGQNKQKIYSTSAADALLDRTDFK